ncbi:MAG: hypothetical protein ACYDG2_17205 [Ruminiclostridium sp.]
MYIFIVVVFILAHYIGHMPLSKLNKYEMKEIREKGLIHFTDKRSSVEILKDGFKGKVSDMSKLESLLGPLTWLYMSGNEETIEKKHNIVLEKKKGKDFPENYGICLHIMGITDTDLSHMVVRRGLWRDRAIVYKGEFLKPSHITINRDYIDEG